jgi:hypothetical protein
MSGRPPGSRAWVVALACALAGPATLAAAAEPVLSVQAEPAGRPWWQRATWHPRANTVHGISIKRLQPEWCAAEALSRELIGEQWLGPAADAAPDGLSFSIEASFDGSGKLQTAFVGAYRRCDGERGLFVAIVDRLTERPRLRFLVEVPDPGTALALLGREPDGALAVWWCTDCNNGHRIAYNRESRGFYVAGAATRR